MSSSWGFLLSLTASSLATTNELEISQLGGFPTRCKVLRLSMKNKNFFAKLPEKWTRPNEVGLSSRPTELQNHSQRLFCQISQSLTRLRTFAPIATAHL